MVCGLIYNSFYKGVSYLNNIKLFKNGIEQAGAMCLALSNEQVYSEYIYNMKELPFSKALFLDKDLNLAYRLEQLGIRLYNSADTIRICDDKGLTQVYLDTARVPAPKTYLPPFTYGNIGYPDGYFTPQMLPAVIKESHGSFGEQVYLAKSHDEYFAVIKKISPRPFIVQEYLPEGNTDTRVFVLGGKAMCCMKRSNPNDFRSNAELGGICSPCELDADAARVAEGAAKAVGADFCGADLIRHNDRYYVIEVNSNPMINNLLLNCSFNIPLAVGRHIKDCR